MSVVQGTVIDYQATFRDPETKVPADQPDVTLKVVRPDDVVIRLSLSGGTITRLDEGVYGFSIDTSPAYGSWDCELASVGEQAVVKRWQELVAPRIQQP